MISLPRAPPTFTSSMVLAVRAGSGPSSLSSRLHFLKLQPSCIHVPKPSVISPPQLKEAQRLVLQCPEPAPATILTLFSVPPPSYPYSGQIKILAALLCTIVHQLFVALLMKLLQVPLLPVPLLPCGTSAPPHLNPSRPSQPALCHPHPMPHMESSTIYQV